MQQLYAALLYTYICTFACLWICIYFHSCFSKLFLGLQRGVKSHFWSKCDFLQNHVSFLAWSTVKRQAPIDQKPQGFDHVLCLGKNASYLKIITWFLPLKKRVKLCALHKDLFKRHYSLMEGYFLSKQNNRIYCSAWEAEH